VIREWGAMNDPARRARGGRRRAGGGEREARGARAKVH